ncbi:MAG: hypothetical protein ACLRZ2_01610 [Veillonella sp.]
MQVRQIQICSVTGPILGIGAFMHSALTNALVVQSAAPHLRGTTAGFVNLFTKLVLSCTTALKQCPRHDGGYQMS